MRERRVRVVKPFTNSFGQVIEPGTPVFVITVCTHQTNIAKGEYIGYIERDASRYDRELQQFVAFKEPFVQARVECDTSRCVYKDTGENVVWSKFDANRANEWVTTKGTRITTLLYNRILRADSSLEEMAAAV